MFATIREGRLFAHEDIPSLEEMQDVVGGWITSALRVPSSTRKGVAVDVWVNDEGLLMNLPIRFVRSTDHSFLAGDLILSASNAGGETIPATEAELDDALSHLLPLAEPLINYSEIMYSLPKFIWV